VARSKKHEIGVGVLVLVAGGLLAYMSMQVGALRSLGDKVDLTVELTDAAGLSDGAAVRIAGVQVGQVQSMGVEHDKAIIEITVNTNAQIREDASVQVRARSILGEKYLEISPRTEDAELLTNGGRLTIVRPQTEIDELVNSLGPLVAAMDAEAVGEAMDRLAQALQDDPDRLARMLQDLDTVLANSASASQELPSTIQETRATLTQIRSTAARTKPLLAKSEAIIDKLDGAADSVPEITEDVRLLVKDTRAMVADTRTTMQRVERMSGDMEIILKNFKEIDRWELRRLLREEGILLRLRKSEVKEPKE
jgi:phospholipid/cholesterol/gamma-HCH transport system substrate-binding protein